jgi:hypothetical protein
MLFDVEESSPPQVEPRITGASGILPWLTSIYKAFGYISDDSGKEYFVEHT